MRIDGTYGPGPAGLPEEKGIGPKADRAKAGGEPAVPQTELIASQKEYVRSASDTQEVNKQAVAEARQLIRDGKLDTPEAARRAAESILDLGI